MLLHAKIVSFKIIVSCPLIYILGYAIYINLLKILGFNLWSRYSQDWIEDLPHLFKHSCLFTLDLQFFLNITSIISVSLVKILIKNNPYVLRNHLFIYYNNGTSNKARNERKKTSLYLNEKIWRKIQSDFWIVISMIWIFRRAFYICWDALNVVFAKISFENLIDDYSTIMRLSLVFFFFRLEKAKKKIH